MHFIILKENLAKALVIVGRFLSIRSQLPILSNILIKAKNNQLSLSATNLELGIIFTIGAKIEKEGETTVPGKLLIDFITALNTDKIEFILEGTNLKVVTKKTRATFATANSTDFPPFPSISEAKKKLALKNLKESMLRVVFAASSDEARPVLTGVRTIINKGTISLSATDGYRLSVEQVATPDKKEELQAILPARSLLEIVRVATDINVEEVGFSILEDKNQVVFTFPNVVIFTRLIEGEFPNIEKIIPAGAKTKVEVDKDQLIQAIKTTSLFARGAANIIKVKIEKEGLRLSANNPQIGEDEDFVEAKVEGEELEIAFNYRFLIDLLNYMPGDSLIFETSGPLNPGVFKPTAANISFLHLIMPVRVQG